MFALGSGLKLNWTGCEIVGDVSALVNIHTLDLAGIWRISSRSTYALFTLGRAYSLNLCSYDDEVDVSSVVNVHELHVSYCEKEKVADMPCIFI